MSISSLFKEASKLRGTGHMFGHDTLRVTKHEKIPKVLRICCSSHAWWYRLANLKGNRTSRPMGYAKWSIPKDIVTRHRCHRCQKCHTCVSSLCHPWKQSQNTDEHMKSARKMKGMIGYRNRWNGWKFGLGPTYLKRSNIALVVFWILNLKRHSNSKFSEIYCGTCAMLHQGLPLYDNKTEVD